MKRVFGLRKDKEPMPSIQDLSDRINKRGDTVDEKLKKLDADLSRYNEQIKKTRPGPAQEAIKARALKVLKAKRMYEGQRDMLYNQTLDLNKIAFAFEGLKDAQQTRPEGQNSGQFRRSFFSSLIGIGCLPHERTCNINMDPVNVGNEIQETLGRSYNVPDELMTLMRMNSWVIAELDVPKADMGSESDGIPSYLQTEKEESGLDAELNFHSVPTGNNSNSWQV